MRLLVFMLLLFANCISAQVSNIINVGNNIIINTSSNGDRFNNNLFFAKNPPPDDYYCGDKSCLLNGFTAIVTDNTIDSVFNLNIDTLAADSIYWIYFETVISDGDEYRYPFLIRYMLADDEEFNDTIVLTHFPNVLFTYTSNYFLYNHYIYTGKYKNNSGKRYSYWLLLIPKIYEDRRLPYHNGCNPQFILYTEYFALYRFCSFQYIIE